MALCREIERDGAAVEHAEHDDFAVQAGGGRDAEHDILSAHRDADAPILRQAPLGDVELGEDFQARDDGRGEAGRMRFGILQLAIITVADAHAVLERLDMNVRGHALDRLGDDLVDQPDHRRLARQILQPLGIIFRCFDGFRCFRGGFGLGVKPVEGCFKFDRYGDFEARLHPRGERDGGAGEMVERVGHGDDQTCRAGRDRQRHARGRRAENAGAAGRAKPGCPDSFPESQWRCRAGSPSFPLKPVRRRGRAGPAPANS